MKAQNENFVNADVKNEIVPVQNEKFVNLKGKDEFERIEAFLDFLFLPGDVVQLRALGTKWKNGSNGGNLSSYYQRGHQTNNFAKLALHASNITDGNLRASADGCYFTINALREGAIHWGAEPDKTVKSPTDEDVTFRRTLFVDCDPVRIQDGKQEKKIAANAEEREHAKNRALVIRDYLLTEGFPEPAILDSGNGFSLFYPCSIPVSEETDKAFEGILHYLAENYDNDHVQVDTSVTNRSRIGRLPETWNRKGAGHEPRPHRKAQIYSLPADRVEVTLDQIQKLAALRKSEAAPKPVQPGETSGEKRFLTGWNLDQLRVRLDEFFEKYNAHKDNENNPISIVGEKIKGNTLWIEFNRCPFHPDHLKSAVSFDVEGDKIGLTGFKCFHKTCDKSNWKYIRELMRELGVSSGNAIEVNSDDEIAAALGIVAPQAPAKSRFDTPEMVAAFNQHVTNPVADPGANSQPDPNDEDARALRDAGIEILDFDTDKRGTKRWIVKCPCCNRKGGFFRNPDLTGGYNCIAKKRSWKEGEKLWTNGRKCTPEQLMKKYGDDLLFLPQMKQRYAAQIIDWVADGWLQAGHLTILSGREKRGKSTAIYDLITAVLTGQKWMDAVDTTRVPILLLDYENPGSYIVANVMNMIDARRANRSHEEFKDEDFENYFAILDPDLIRTNCSPIDKYEIVARIDRMKELTGATTGLFIIDTASPAFAALFEDPNWTNSSSQVRQAMEIVQQIARETNWHVQVIYHENKSGTGASGSYEWTATADAFLRFERNEDDLSIPEGTISLAGRLLHPPKPIKFRLADGLLHAIEESVEQAPERPKMAGENQNYWRFLEKLPLEQGDALNQSQIYGVFAADPKQKDKLVLAQAKVREFLNHGMEKGEIQMKKGDHNANYYWHTPNLATNDAFANAISE